MKARAIGLDLDGTLLDTRARHVEALRMAANASGCPMSRELVEAFYDKKREGLPGVDVLRAYSIPAAEEIIKIWVEIIESEPLLELDVVFPGVVEQLAALKRRGCQTYIVTARQNEDLACAEIVRLGLHHLITGVFVVPPVTCESRILTKWEVSQGLDIGIVVGDSEADLEWARTIGADFLAVASGIRSKQYWLSRSVVPFDNVVLALSEYMKRSQDE